MPCLQLGAAPCPEVCWLFIYRARGLLFYTKVSSLRPACGFCSPSLPAPLWNVRSRFLDGRLRTRSFCWFSLPSKVLGPSFLRASAAPSAGPDLLSSPVAFFRAHPEDHSVPGFILFIGSPEQGLILKPKSTAPSVSCLWGIVNSPVLQPPSL